MSVIRKVMDLEKYIVPLKQIEIIKEYNWDHDSCKVTILLSGSEHGILETLEF